MNADYQDYKHKELTEKIIETFYRVYNRLGYGFLEKAYENALVIEFRKAGIHVLSQAPLRVFYESQIIGEYCADLLVDGKVIVQIKATRKLLQEHKAQLLNYLKASDIEVGLLLNFGPRPEVKRKAFDNRRK
jgi:GxxExxY protein